MQKSLMSKYGVIACTLGGSVLLSTGMLLGVSWIQKRRATAGAARDAETQQQIHSKQRQNRAYETTSPDRP